jgi:starch synthase
MTDSLHVAMLASEMVPFAKTGGLADVVGALPKALSRLGHRVTVFVPRYRQVRDAGKVQGVLQVPLGGESHEAVFSARDMDTGVRVVFVGNPRFFDRQELYGEGNRDYPDNSLRYGFFSRAVLEFYRSRGERPDVFHCHDWQTGLAPVFLKTHLWDDPSLARCATVFTIHNLAYQGIFNSDTLALLGLPEHLRGSDALEFHGSISFMKGGLFFSEILNTVSPRYASEIQELELGCGLDGVLRLRASDLHGILNGVDYDEWDPRHDPHLPEPYSSEDLSGKATCKNALLDAFDLPRLPELPLVGITSRLVSQKGFDLVVDAWQGLLRRPLRMVILGTGDRSIQDGFRALAARMPGRFAVRFAYDNTLAHLIEAGSDAFLMPSRFEPCGLSQLYSMRYGTPPIVRATGGLADTVKPYSPETGEGTGFSFAAPTGQDLLAALDQALAVYGQPKAWMHLMRNGMAQDFSWDRSAEGYVELYGQARAKT